MPVGVWEKCGNVGGTTASGYTFTCTKKAGHKGTEHANTKSVPCKYWKDKTGESE